MSSTQGRGQRKTQIRMFRFLDLNWVEILTGEVLVDAQNKKVKIIYENSGNDHLIPACIPSPLRDEQHNQKIIQIVFSRINRVELDESDKKIVYFWVDVQPFSVSCLSEMKAKQLCQLLELAEQNIDGGLDQQGAGQLSIQWVRHCFESNPGMVSILFTNGKSEVIDVLMKEVQNLIERGPTQQEKQIYFFLFKVALRLGNKQVIERMIQDQNYNILLRILSWNSFNDKNYDYVEEYNKLINFNNIVGIDDRLVLECYEGNAKVKFLRDVAACMFIEAETERCFQSIINVNNQIILRAITTQPKILDAIIKLADTNPKSFLSVFIQLWNIFKATTTPQYQNRHFKDDFVKTIKQKNIHNLAVKAADLIVDQFECNQLTARFHEKWIQSFNPFLSFQWEIAQQWMCTSKEPSLIKVILKLFNKCNDEGLIQAILVFIKWLIQPSDNRVKMENKFKCYVYNEFISQIFQTMNKSVFLTQQFVDFLIKLYKTDHIRTRRILIQNKVLNHLQDQIQKKPILICIIKLLDTFLEKQSFDVFTYLNNHFLFLQLKQWYLRNVHTHNVINSCFRSLFKKIQQTNNIQVLKYFSIIFQSKKQKIEVTATTQNGVQCH